MGYLFSVIVCCKVIIKQEPGEAPHVSTTGAASQSAFPQYVTVKGGHMIAVSPQKQVISAGEGTTQSPKIAPSKVCMGLGWESHVQEIKVICLHSWQVPK
jgi:hypothetical protein